MNDIISIDNNLHGGTFRHKGQVLLIALLSLA